LALGLRLLCVELGLEVSFAKFN